MAGYDLVLGALPSVLGFQTLEAVIAAGKDYCDISFMPENALELDARARERGVYRRGRLRRGPGREQHDGGLSPPRASTPSRASRSTWAACPSERRWPFDYKAGFAPFDVIEEYTRPARIVEHGRVVVKEALSEPERMDFPGVGTLEAFNTDGLRSLVHTLEVPFMKEKTLRYPGHIELMRAFRETGLLLEGAAAGGRRDGAAARRHRRAALPEVDLRGGRGRPHRAAGDREGLENGRPARYTWDLLDRFDPATGLRSMSRTTAFPAAIMAGLMLEGAFRRPGVHAPESVGREPGLLDRMLAELEARGVVCRQSVDGRRAGRAPSPEPERPWQPPTNARPEVRAGEALTLPARFYTDPELFRRELQAIHYDMWLYAGRTEQLPAPGSYFVVRFAGASVIVLRDERGRGRRLPQHLPPPGHAAVQGRQRAASPGASSARTTPGPTASTAGCVNAPHMEKVEGFREEDHPLGRVATAVWDGHVFINLSEKPLPFAEHLAGLDRKFAPWGMGELRRAERKVYHLKANWKLVIQNYSECIHCPIAHPQLNKQSHYMSGDNEPPQPTYLGGRMDLREGCKTLSRGRPDAPARPCPGSPPRTSGASTTTRSCPTCS